MNWLKLAPQFSCSLGAIGGRPVRNECVCVCVGWEITFARGVAFGGAKSHRNASRFTFEMPFRGHVDCVLGCTFFFHSLLCVCVVHLLHAVLHFYVSHTHTHIHTFTHREAAIQADRQTGCPAVSPLSQYNSRRRCRRRRCCRRLCGGCSHTRSMQSMRSAQRSAGCQRARASVVCRVSCHTVGGRGAERGLAVHALDAWPAQWCGKQ